MRRHIVATMALITLGMTPEAHASGAAITVLGDSDAYECFMNASVRSAAVSSLDSCRKAITSGDLATKDHAATLVNMGIILNSLARMDEAMGVFEEALGMSPNLPEAILSRGNSHFLRKDYDRAIADYELSLVHGVKDPAAAHFNHGMAHGKKRNFRQAAVSYERALELKPDFGRAQARLDRLKQLGLTQQTAPRPKPITN